MTFTKFVEVGRVAYVIKGPEKGKLVTFVDIIDYNRVLVDGPCTDVPRQEYRLINLLLTKYKIKIQHGQHTKFVRKAWEEAKISERWAKSEWAKFVQLKERRENLTDLERFQVVYLKRAENRAIKLVSKLSLNRKNLISRGKALKVERVKSNNMKKISKSKPPHPKICKLYATLRTKNVLKKTKKPKAEKEDKKKKPRPDAKKGKTIRPEGKQGKTKAEKYAEFIKKKALALKAKKEGGVAKPKTATKAKAKPRPTKSEKPAAAAKKPAPAAKKPAPAKKAAPKKAPAASKKPAAPKPKKAEAKAK